jgi:hypothetical protein
VLDCGFGGVVEIFVTELPGDLQNMGEEMRTAIEINGLGPQVVLLLN